MYWGRRSVGEAAGDVNEGVGVEYSAPMADLQKGGASVGQMPKMRISAYPPQKSRIAERQIREVLGRRSIGEAAGDVNEGIGVEYIAPMADFREGGTGVGQMPKMRISAYPPQKSRIAEANPRSTGPTQRRGGCGRRQRRHRCQIQRTDGRLPGGGSGCRPDAENAHFSPWPSKVEDCGGRSAMYWADTASIWLPRRSCIMKQSRFGVVSKWQSEQHQPVASLRCGGIEEIESNSNSKPPHHLIVLLLEITLKN
ncbi:hypothetical protein B0H19DRAFT_1239853 [Mycena capillaripes]|nr:hypothetical protein B0H19DRAFT_1239853 [Mycena capillaripes]